MLIPTDHDFIKTIEGFYFCVVGYQHPEDRIISYLKYIPWESGKWRNGETFLKRVLRHYSASEVLRSFKHFEGNFQHYVFKDPINNIIFTAVPEKFISNYYKPQDAVYNITHSDSLDALQEKAFDFIVSLSKKANVPIEDFGITGSILLDIHNPSFSDIDLTIHGHKSAFKIQKIVKKEMDLLDSPLKRIPKQEKDQWVQRKISQYKLSKEQVELILMRKWNFGYYDDVKFSIHPIRKESEIKEKYGMKKFEDKGFIEARARIKEDTESIYLPCKYVLEDVDIVKGKEIQDLRELVSFEGFYCFVAKKGELVQIKGKLEKVSGDNKSYHRVVIGSFKAKEQDYILPILNS
ncbi:MAG: hypothetical protein EAX96_04435 [Candidatus Lokiarchaeota archaeon]|nr:hypothetical protein [Candidatus Lokiarchaeota archaeon]